MKQILLLTIRVLVPRVSPTLFIQAVPPSFNFRRHFVQLLTGLIILFLVPSAWAQQDILVGLTSMGGLQIAGTAFTMKSDGSGFTVQKNFAKSGKRPYGDLIKATDGSFYGMNYLGGTFDKGNIFKMSSAGAITSLHSFDSAKDGGNPYGSLVQGSDGNFYGMTNSGGFYGAGTIFRIMPNGTYTVLHHFNSTSDGGRPRGNLVQGKNGNFYGLTVGGGTYFYGTIFCVSPGGVYTVLRHLDKTNDGGFAFGSLLQGSDGNFYGITNTGGTNGAGTIFRISPAGLFSVLRHLNLSTDGGDMSGNSLIQASDKNFYGMLHKGGTFGRGTIFKITLAGTYTVLRNLDYSTDGGYPNGSLVQGNDGNFYGMTIGGGSFNSGTIFRITPQGTYTVLRNLDNTNDGGSPKGTLVKDNSGTFYGMTSHGGSYNYGAIFKITTTGTYTVLVQFPDSSGGNPYGNLIQARDGSFYGMTTQGGSHNNGSIFKLCGSSFSTITSFQGATSGNDPRGSLVQGTDGNFYGMTSSGGGYGVGTIFKMTPGGTLTVLRSLNNRNDGGTPFGSLVQGVDGNLYGIARQGGTHGLGTIFKITPGGDLTVLHHFNYPNVYYPNGNLILGKDGNFYGITSMGGIVRDGEGTIFRMAPNGSLTILHSFNDLPVEEGIHPVGGLVQDSDGNFYGMTTASSYNTSGSIIFKYSLISGYSVLHRLDPVNEGALPNGSLVQGSDNSMYGMTSKGGTYGAGTIFKITTDGTITVLRHLNPSTDGGSPLGSLVVQKANPVANAQSITTAVNSPKAITLTGLGGTPLDFKVSGQPQHGTLTGSNAKRIYTPNPGFTGTDSFNFRVIWGCQSSTSKKVTITVGNAGNTVRLNTGGSAVATTLGSFTADNFFSGATSISTTAATINNTTHDALYQDNRRATSAGGSFLYNIPVSKGSYIVKLHFAEIFYGTAGKRKFNVIAEGTSWLSNYDIYAAAGGAKRAIVATKTITVSDGTLNLNFISQVDKACVSAIEVLPVAGGERLATEGELAAESTLARSIYPNPVKTLLMVQLRAPTDNLQTSIKDAAGAEVRHNVHQVVGRDKLQINVASLPAGLYLLQLETYQGRQTFKFMKE